MWITYECENDECRRKFAVEDDLEEPACPEYSGTNCKEMNAQ
ncbi:hypothetical protein [Paenibacillus macquariensis]|uniref:Uncharacterized protein n=1 Tax=Paenibacillus macquariensis TaxID=948756 RepID=A0ABY1KER7_9BACL|nr:hypothetical protein [Paenibacillus macquariensis]MEC0092483.1 hypothetical protein [Paenibacillus macquariensis]SIR72582.1 hypothetical protein SAMN05421578_1482 [Paenibacillus macquariensis]